MGWDVTLYMRFNEDRADTWSNYLTLIEELSRLVDTFQVGTIYGFNNSLIPGRELFAERFVSETPRRFRAFLDNADQSRLIVKTGLSVVRQSWEPYVGTTAGPLRTALFLRGSEASWNPVKGAERFNLIWRVGDSRHYDQLAPKSSWKPNCQRLISEIELLACLGSVKEIWGGQESFNGEPENAFLRYTSDGTAVSAGIEAVPDELDVRRLGNGVLIWRRDFIRGRLEGIEMSS